MLQRYVWASFSFMHVIYWVSISVHTKNMCQRKALKVVCMYSMELFEDSTTQILSAFAQLHTFSLTNDILIYIHTLTDLFTIRKPAWTSVICDNTGTCPNSGVCINVGYCKWCLKRWDPQFCNMFWKRKVMSKAYLEMRYTLIYNEVYYIAHAIIDNLNYNEWKWFVFTHRMHPLHSKP